MNNSYTEFATLYDRLIKGDIDYKKIASFIKDELKIKTDNIILDLACGTGSLTAELKNLGFDMIGIDLSVDMLNIAKEKNPDIKVIAVEPYDSPLLTEGKAGPHKIQGIGANFIPENLDSSIYDEVMTIKTEEAYEACRKLAKGAGVLVGISSGAAVCIAHKLSKLPENKGKTSLQYKRSHQ